MKLINLFALTVLVSFVTMGADCSPEPDPDPDPGPTLQSVSISPQVSEGSNAALTGNTLDVPKNWAVNQMDANVPTYYTFDIHALGTDGLQFSLASCTLTAEFGGTNPTAFTASFSGSTVSVNALHDFLSNGDLIPTATFKVKAVSGTATVYSAVYNLTGQLNQVGPSWTVSLDGGAVNIMTGLYQIGKTFYWTNWSGSWGDGLITGSTVTWSDITKDFTGIIVSDQYMSGTYIHVSLGPGPWVATHPAQ